VEQQPAAAPTPAMASVPITAPAPKAAGSREIRLVAPTKDELNDITKMWNRVERACEHSGRLSALLADMKFKSRDGDRAVLEVDPKLFGAAKSLESDLQKAMSEAFGMQMSLLIESATIVEEATREEASKPTTNMSEHALVKQAIELFGAKLISVSPRRKS
jgi:hypothetical protein